MRTLTTLGLGTTMAGAIVVQALLAPAGAQGLSEKSVRTFMEYAWSLTPQRFTKPDGVTVEIDKTKRETVMVPLETAREVIMVGRLSAHAQMCHLVEEQVQNYRSLMLREEQRKKWSEQQVIFINQLHLTTVMLLTGKIKLIEHDGDKEIVIHESKEPEARSCTPEQAATVRDRIAAYVKTGPALAAARVPAAPAPAPAPATTPASAPSPPAKKK